MGTNNYYLTLNKFFSVKYFVSLCYIAAIMIFQKLLWDTLIPALLNIVTKTEGSLVTDFGTSRGYANMSLNVAGKNNDNIFLQLRHLKSARLSLNRSSLILLMYFYFIIINLF